LKKSRSSDLDVSRRQEVVWFPFSSHFSPSHVEIGAIVLPPTVFVSFSRFLHPDSPGCFIVTSRNFGAYCQPFYDVTGAPAGISRRDSL
jgi:hypothetical protein